MSWLSLHVVPAREREAALAALFAAAVFELLNFDTIVGIKSPIVDGLPWLIIATLAIGVLIGLWTRRSKPARYARLAQSRLRPQARRLAQSTISGSVPRSKR